MSEIKLEGIEKFKELYGKDPEWFFTAPGRIEVSGNHTDHQHGRVMAAAIDLDTVAYVATNEDGMIRIFSEGYDPVEIDPTDLALKEEEKGHSAALVRGVASAFYQLGAQLGGFDAYSTSSVLQGSGLSSSASYEVLLGTIINTLFFEGKCDPVRIAQIGQFAENQYYGKPSGLMDQTACSVGNFITIDFADPSNPIVEKIDFDFEKSGHSVVVIDTHANHADLTPEYASIVEELRRACNIVGVNYMREVKELDFYFAIPEIREKVGDRAVLRGLHILDENKRVAKQTEALKHGDFDTFLENATLSGQSSWMLLQNVIPSGKKLDQNVAVAMQLAWKFLGGRGAVRVNGGGFAGTILTFVPNDQVDRFVACMDGILGEGSCHILKIRPEGGTAEKIDMSIFMPQEESLEENDNALSEDMLEPVADDENEVALGEIPQADVPFSEE